MIAQEIAEYIFCDLLIMTNQAHYGDPMQFMAVSNGCNVSAFGATYQAPQEVLAGPGLVSINGWGGSPQYLQIDPNYLKTGLDYYTTIGQYESAFTDMKSHIAFLESRILAIEEKNKQEQEWYTPAGLNRGQLFSYNDVLSKKTMMTCAELSIDDLVPCEDSADIRHTALADGTMGFAISPEIAETIGLDYTRVSDQTTITDGVVNHIVMVSPCTPEPIVNNPKEKKLTMWDVETSFDDFALTVSSDDLRVNFTHALSHKIIDGKVTSVEIVNGGSGYVADTVAPVTVNLWNTHAISNIAPPFKVSYATTKSYVEDTMEDTIASTMGREMTKAIDEAIMDQLYASMISTSLSVNDCTRISSLVGYTDDACQNMKMSSFSVNQTQYGDSGDSGVRIQQTFN